MVHPLPRAALAAVVAVALAACDEDRGPPRGPLPPDPAPQTAVTSAPAEPSASGAAGTSDGADAGADGGVRLADVAGAWEGAYEAKKGRVGMPSGVPDPQRAADDGKVAAGAGSVSLTIRADGDVEGKSQGALGSATIRGKIDGKMLRASFVPDDMTAPQAMTGVLVGIVKGDRIEAELRVAGPDALLVRQANFDITRKK